MTNERILADVATDLTVECLDGRGNVHHIDTVLGFQRRDAYAVTMTFLTTAGELTWTFGRDLLLRGVHGPAGEGDVRVLPAINRSGQATVLIELTSPDGHLVMEARSDQVTDFLDRTVALVPAGAEGAALDVDELVAQLLGS